jgi:hypothetical protein
VGGHVDVGVPVGVHCGGGGGEGTGCGFHDGAAVLGGGAGAGLGAGTGAGFHDVPGGGAPCAWAVVVARSEASAMLASEAERLITADSTVSRGCRVIKPGVPRVSACAHAPLPG